MSHIFPLKKSIAFAICAIVFLSLTLCGCSSREVSSREAMQVIVGQLMTSGYPEVNPDMIKITNSYTQTVNGEFFCHFDFTCQTKKGNSLWEIILVRRGNQIQTITMVPKDVNGGVDKEKKGFFSSLWGGIKIGGLIIGTLLGAVILLVGLISGFVHLLSYVSRNPSVILHFFIEVVIVASWVLAVSCSVSMVLLSLNNIPYFPYSILLWSGLVLGVTVCCISRTLFAFTFWTCIIINGFVIGLGLYFYDSILIHKWTSPPPVPYGCILFQGLIFGIAWILYYTVLKKSNDDCGS